ncbi:MAG: hypothetical protein K5705_01110 [Oscillospiraceae bacterium]|nr:hypothetical protein [Oscillospiraceae bacterium]MCR4758865.1 hypothetical protein [Oscillospiraceae bacterium]
MKQSLKETILRVLILLVGLVTAHFGVTLFLLSDLGADPFNVLIQGLLRTLTGFGLTFLTHGITHMAVCVLIILILLLTDRSYIRIGTLICMVFGGPIIDFFSWLLSPLKIGALPFAAKLGVLAASCVILAFGMTVVIKSEAGTGPNDLVAVVISDKSKKRFGIIRILTDFSFVLLGALQGGIWGIGTLVCAFLVGPAANFFLPRSEKLTAAIISICLKNSPENGDHK